MLETSQARDAGLLHHFCEGVEREGQRCFETLSYRRALFPLFPGETVIPPATLSYSLPLSTSFFSREEFRRATPFSNLPE